MKFISSLLLLFIFGLSANAQNDYYVTKNEAFYGVKLVESTENQACKYAILKRGSEHIHLFPDSIVEYSINGQVYISKSIDLNGKPKLVFIKRLVKGELTLYAFKDQRNKLFFLEQDGKIKQLTQVVERNKTDVFTDDFADILSDCQILRSELKRIPYSQSQAVMLVKKFNNCETYKRKLNIGAQFGLLMNKLILPEQSGIDELSILEFNYQPSISIGAFITKPFLLSDFSFQLEIYFTQSSYSSTAAKNDNNIEFSAKTSTIRMPIALQYNVASTGMLKPFVKAGPLFSYDLKNEYSVLEYSKNQDVITFKKLETDVQKPKLSAGYSIGFGIAYELNEDHIVNLQFSLNKLNSLSNGGLNKSEFHLTMGVTL